MSRRDSNTIPKQGETASMTVHTGKDFFHGILEKQSDKFLGLFSGEFYERDLENSFQKETWTYYRKNARNVLLFVGLISVAFIAVDLLTTQGKTKILVLSLRGIGGIFLVGSSIYVQRARFYFDGFPLLVLANHAVIVMAMMLIGLIARLPPIHNLFHLFIATLFSYLWVQNRFSYTFSLNILLQTAYFAASYHLYHLGGVDLIRFVFYISAANIMGVVMLRNVNRSRRGEFIRLAEEQHLNLELRDTVSSFAKPDRK
jgi:hypothetical protein